MDFFTACRKIREVFPKPVKKAEVESFLSEFNKSEQNVAFKSLAANWRSLGWQIDFDSFAILLDDDEEAMFHDKGITVIKLPDDLPSDRAYLKLIPMNEINDKVVWF